MCVCVFLTFPGDKSCQQLIEVGTWVGTVACAHTGIHLRGQSIVLFLHRRGAGSSRKGDREGGQKHAHTHATVHPVFMCMGVFETGGI